MSFNSSAHFRSSHTQPTLTHRRADGTRSSELPSNMDARLQSVHRVAPLHAGDEVPLPVSMWLTITFSISAWHLCWRTRCLHFNFIGFALLSMWKWNVSEPTKLRIRRWMPRIPKYMDKTLHSRAANICVFCYEQGVPGLYLLKGKACTFPLFLNTKAELHWNSLAVGWETQARTMKASLEHTVALGFRN